MYQRYFTMEHNNTGKSPKKCYSCKNEGMDKLTEDKVKILRARVLTQMSLSDDSSYKFITIILLLTAKA